MKDNFIKGKLKSCTTEFEDIHGIEFVLMQLDEDKVIVHGATTVDGYEKYFNYLFNSFGKRDISDDYKYFLEYMLSEECEFVNVSYTDYFEDIVKFDFEKDSNDFVQVLEEFKKKNSIK